MLLIAVTSPFRRVLIVIMMVAIIMAAVSVVLRRSFM